MAMTRHEHVRAAEVPGARYGRKIDWEGPRRLLSIMKVRCAVMDDQGRVCTNMPVWLVAVHGNGEYDRWWYAVPMCTPHMEHRA